jgi:hypothetical protein
VTYFYLGLNFDTMILSVLRQFNFSMPEQYKPNVEQVQQIPNSPEQGEQPFNFENWLNVELPKQYEKEYKILVKVGIMGILPEILEDGILGIDGREYPVPSLEQIQSAILANREKYESKMKQGFTKLQMTPFALPLRILIQTLERTLLAHHKQGKLLAPKKNPNGPDVKLELNKNQPVYTWKSWWNKKNSKKSKDELGEIIYDPQQFTQENHGGQTKQEKLDGERVKQAQGNTNIFPGWNIELYESNENIPRERKGKTIGGRKQLEANDTPENYLKILQTNPQYAHEKGLTFESWITKALGSLKTNNTVLDDYSGAGFACYLLANWISSGYLGFGRWARCDKQARLSGVNLTHQSPCYGCRSAVCIKD